MATFTTAVVIASAGDLSMAPGVAISFSVTLGIEHQPLSLDSRVGRYRITGR